MGFGRKKHHGHGLNLGGDDDSSSVTSNESNTRQASPNGMMYTGNEAGISSTSTSNSGNMINGGVGGGGGTNSGGIIGLRTIGNASRSFMHKHMGRDSLGSRFPDSERGESRQRASFLIDNSNNNNGESEGKGNNKGIQDVLIARKIIPNNNSNENESPTTKDRNGFMKTPRATLIMDNEAERTPRGEQRTNKNEILSDNGTTDEAWGGNGGKSRLMKKKTMINNMFSKHRNKR